MLGPAGYNDPSNKAFSLESEEGRRFHEDNAPQNWVIFCTGLDKEGRECHDFGQTANSKEIVLYVNQVTKAEQFTPPMFVNWDAEWVEQELGQSAAVPLISFPFFHFLPASFYSPSPVSAHLSCVILNSILYPPSNHATISCVSRSQSIVAGRRGTRAEVQHGSHQPHLRCLTPQHSSGTTNEKHSTARSRSDGQEL